jgi:hypothetical protein
MHIVERQSRHGAMPFAGLRDAILTHPTVAEGLNTLFGNVPPRHDAEFDDGHSPAGAQNRP